MIRKIYINDKLKDLLDSVNRSKLLEATIRELNEPAQTDILQNLTFKTLVDREVFDRLPLSDRQKELMIFELYPCET